MGIAQGENDKNIQQLLQIRILFDIYNATTFYPVILKTSWTPPLSQGTNRFLSYNLSFFVSDSLVFQFSP